MSFYSVKNGIGRFRDSRQIEINSSGQDVVTVNGQFNSKTDHNLVAVGGMDCIDQTHPNFGRYFDPDVLTDWGGPLDLLKVSYRYPVVGNRAGNAKGSYVKRTYTGAIHAQPGLILSKTLTPEIMHLYAKADDAATRWGYGATAIERCKPGSPQAAFGTTLAELLRDGIPSILHRFQFQSQLEFYRSLGSNYLNVEFGWKPFVADIQASARALLNQAKLLEDLSRNSGKRMRRQYVFPGETTTSTLEKGASYFPWPTLTNWHWTQGGCTITETKKKRTWFAGEFVYRVPSDFSNIGSIKAKARYLLGIELTPSYLWQIAPWTWLSDWFANIGDVLSNIASITEDDLVIRYAYLMQEARHETKTTHRGVRTFDGSVPDVIEGVTTVTHKTRIGASPYGFGWTWDDFSPRQLAILAALGITRGGNRK